MGAFFLLFFLKSINLSLIKLFHYSIESLGYTPMKRLLFLILFFFSFSAFSQTDFSAHYISSTQQLSVSWADDSYFPPFEAGELWTAIKGTDQRKYVDVDGFSLECEALRNSRQELFGSCTLLIPIKALTKVNDILVFKLKGVKARKLNQYFIDSAYVSTQRNQVYLSSANTRSEFYFGIKETLIK